VVVGRRGRDLVRRRQCFSQPAGRLGGGWGGALRVVEGRLYRVRRHLREELGGVFHG